MRIARARTCAAFSLLGGCLLAALFAGYEPQAQAAGAGPDKAAAKPKRQSPGAPLPPSATQASPSSTTLLALDIDFEFNRATLTAADKKTIDGNVDAICKLVAKHKQLTIEGHSDSRGPAERNAQVSQERAAAVREEILANKRCHIEPQALVAVGVGEKEPRRCHEPPECDGKEKGPKSCENCWNENRMTVLSIPLDPAAAPVASAPSAAPEPAPAPAGISPNCSRVLQLGQERGSRMCEPH
jgi:outer membrane protein OmpA-like peptidoglycan-associated protein